MDPQRTNVQQQQPTARAVVDPPAVSRTNPSAKSASCTLTHNMRGSNEDKNRNEPTNNRSF